MTSVPGPPWAVERLRRSRRASTSRWISYSEGCIDAGRQARWLAMSECSRVKAVQDRNRRNRLERTCI